MRQGLRSNTRQPVDSLLPRTAKTDLTYVTALDVGPDFHARLPPVRIQKLIASDLLIRWSGRLWQAFYGVLPVGYMRSIDSKALII